MISNMVPEPTSWAWTYISAIGINFSQDQLILPPTNGVNPEKQRWKIRDKI